MNNGLLGDAAIHHPDSADVTMCPIITFPFSQKRHKAIFIFSAGQTFKLISHAKS
jgi:hypothetical protein